MKKYFYSHIVDFEPLSLELEELDLEEHEREELRDLIDSNVYHAILEAIMDELSEEDKKVFLEHISHDNHDKVWSHLRTRVENIEDKIKSAAELMMRELYKDIKDVKNDDSES